MAEEGVKVEVSEEMEKFISYIENMSVLELSKLVKALEDRLGVTAAAPAAAGRRSPRSTISSRRVRSSSRC